MSPGLSIALVFVGLILLVISWFAKSSRKIGRAVLGELLSGVGWLVFAVGVAFLVLELIKPLLQRLLS